PMRRACRSSGSGALVLVLGLVRVVRLDPVHLDDAGVEVDRAEPPALSVARIARLGTELAAREHLSQYAHAATLRPVRAPDWASRPGRRREPENPARARESSANPRIRRQPGKRGVLRPRSAAAAAAPAPRRD